MTVKVTDLIGIWSSLSCVMKAYEHCEQLVREADKDRFLASLFAPADCRAALHALYAFDIETARVRALARQPLPGEIRLQWWRDVLHGERADEAAANPVAAALLDTVAGRGLRREPLLELIEARAFDLYDEPMQTSAQLEMYCEHTSGNILVSAARVLDPSAHLGTPDFVVRAGIAIALTALLRAFALHASRRQLYVPVAVLERHGVHADDVYAARGSPGLLAALAEMREQVRRHMKTADNPGAVASPAASPAILSSALVPLYLARMERPGYDPFRTAIEVPQWRRQWALWRAARRL
jgi:phytoene synthase